jgi:cytochrome P450
VTLTSPTAVHYDPYDVDIDDDPYPTWARLRDEVPLYRNETLDFYALSRWDDVKPALLDWETYRSGRGTVLDIIRGVWGAIVPEGSTMLLLNGSANRDERHFTNPDRFDVHRDEGPHLAFGYGLHFCLGAALARLEGRVALEEILRRWPAWDVDIDRGKMVHTASVRGWGYLPVRPERHVGRQSSHHERK